MTHNNNINVGNILHNVYQQYKYQNQQDSRLQQAT